MWFNLIFWSNLLLALLTRCPTEVQAVMYAMNCGDIYTDTSGWISSPNYPENYEDGVSCRNEIHSNGLATFTITFLDMQIEISGGVCDYDWLRIRNLDDFSNYNVFCGFSIPAPVTYTTTRLEIVFSSDVSDNFKGYNLTYEVDVITTVGTELTTTRSDIITTESEFTTATTTTIPTTTTTTSTTQANTTTTTTTTNTTTPVPTTTTTPDKTTTTDVSTTISPATTAMATTTTTPAVTTTILVTAPLTTEDTIRTTAPVLTTEATTTTTTAPTTTTTTTSTMTTSSSSSADCDILTGKWESTVAVAVLCLEVDLNRQGEVIGLIRTGTDTFWVELIGRTMVDDYSYIGLSGLWPFDLKVESFTGECYRCGGQEHMILDAIVKENSNDIFCQSGGGVHLGTRYNFTRLTSGVCQEMKQQFAH